MTSNQSELTAALVLSSGRCTKRLKELAIKNARLRRRLAEVRLNKDLLQPVAFIHKPVSGDVV